MTLSLIEFSLVLPYSTAIIIVTMSSYPLPFLKLTLFYLSLLLPLEILIQNINSPENCNILKIYWVWTGNERTNEDRLVAIC